MTEEKTCDNVEKGKHGRSELLVRSDVMCETFTENREMSYR